MKRNVLLLALLLLPVTCYLLAPLWAVNVSKVQVAPKRGTLIATVNLEKVFEAYPGTKKAKEEIEIILLVKENEILQKRAEIFKLMQQIGQLKITLSGSSSGVENSSGTLPSKTTSAMEIALAANTTTTSAIMTLSTPTTLSPWVLASSVSWETPQALLIMEKEAELSTKKEELKAMERQTEKNLEDLEQAKTKALLGKIFLSLRELAQERNVDMIVDKNAILWGASSIDLTKELLEKLKIKYIETE